MAEDINLPRYRELEQHIRDKIATGAWQPGHRLPTELELAKMFGVSRITTSRALLELQNAGLVVREQGRGTFVARAEQEAKAGRAPGDRSNNGTNFSGLNVAAMVLPDTAVDSGFKMIEGAEKWLRQRGYRLLSSVSEFNLEHEAELIRNLFVDGVSRLILYPIDSEATAEVVREVAARGMKVVIMDRRLNTLPMPFVGSDNFAAGYAVTKHLVQVGHRLIGFASGDQGLISSVADRFRGYCMALGEHGLPVDPALVINAGQLTQRSPAGSGPGPEGKPNSELVAERTLDYLVGLGSDRPSAVVTANDSTALMLLRMACRRGIKVPEELSITGFDDLAGSAVAEVPLTTVRQQFKLMGKEAAKLVFGEDRDAQGKPREILLPTELVVRHSCGVRSAIEACQ